MIRGSLLYVSARVLLRSVVPACHSILLVLLYRFLCYGFRFKFRSVGFVQRYNELFPSSVGLVRFITTRRRSAFVRPDRRDASVWGGHFVGLLHFTTSNNKNWKRILQPFSVFFSVCCSSWCFISSTTSSSGALVREWLTVWTSLLLPLPPLRRLRLCYLIPIQLFQIDWNFAIHFTGPVWHGKDLLVAVFFCWARSLALPNTSTKRYYILNRKLARPGWFWFASCGERKLKHGKNIRKCSFPAVRAGVVVSVCV